MARKSSILTGYHSIYVLIDPITQQIRYVGQTSRTLEVRLKTHWASYYKNDHRTNWIKSLRKIGQKPLILEIERIFDGKWQDAEKKWITHYRSIGCDLVNGSDGGEGSPGFVASESFRRRMSEVHKGKPLSDEHKEKIRIGNLGRTVSPETREKTSKRCKGVPRSEETRIKISIAQKGKKMSEEQKIKIADRAKERWQDPDFKARMSIAFKNKKKNK